MSKLDSDDALDAAYRRASEADAGRPGAAVRARILAEAQAAARRNAPAANQSRYWMSAVAGVAVLGFTLLMLRQVDAPLPGEVTKTVKVEPMLDSPAPTAPDESRKVEGGAGATQAFEQRALARAPAPVPALPPPPSTMTMEAPPPAVAQAQGNQASAEAASRSEARASAAAEDESQELGEVQVAGSRIVGDRERARVPAAVAPQEAAATRSASPADAQASAAISSTQLVQRHFPDQYASSQAHRLWLVRDAGSGEVLRVGELQAGQQWESVRAQVEASLGNRRVALLRTDSLRNARGQQIELILLEAR